MTAFNPHPRRKLTPTLVREIRRDYDLRRKAKAMIDRGRALLLAVPTCNDYARELGTTENIILSAAMRRTYREVE